MSVLTIFLIALGALLSLGVLLAAAALFTPVVLTVDSTSGELQVRWLVAVEYRRPLPGAKGETRLLFAGKPMSLRARAPQAERKREKRAAAAASKPRRRRAAPRRFFARCLRDSTIRRILIRQGMNLCKGIVRSVELTRWRTCVSLPDPAMTGMLAGLTQFGWGRRSGVQANFIGENSLFLEARFHPHRCVKPVLSVVTRLPYRAMFRMWRACSVRAPAQSV
jgi:hypothetical protein